MVRPNRSAYIRYKQTIKQTDKQSNKQTNKHTNKQTNNWPTNQTNRQHKHSNKQTHTNTQTNTQPTNHFPRTLALSIQRSSPPNDPTITTNDKSLNRSGGMRARAFSRPPLWGIKACQTTLPRSSNVSSQISCQISCQISQISNLISS